MPTVIEKAKKIKSKYQDEWLDYPSIVSIGVGFVEENVIGVIIGVKGSIETIAGKIPEKIDDIPIMIKSVKELRAL